MTFRIRPSLLPWIGVAAFASLALQVVPQTGRATAQQTPSSSPLVQQAPVPILSAGSMVNIAGSFASNLNGGFSIVYTVPAGKNLVLRTAEFSERGSGANFYQGFATNVGLYTGTSPTNATVKVPPFIVGLLLNDDGTFDLLGSQDGLGVVYPAGSNVIVVDDGSTQPLQSANYTVDYWLLGYLTN